eukprot:TRINITY_DN332_c1_g1_i3.p2 TRINITY_DN332_c1_g1~~TRINITY_DN332_c1_g1_i3.p2  ORF type:complete len:271 (-),score=74.24 TRINITY_DN332_c1_g1_i3:64-876(-)
MADQTLEHGEVLNVRWAYVDPNPIAKSHEQQATACQFVNAVEHRVSQMTSKEKAEMEALRQLEQLAENPDAYPDTDAQYRESTSGNTAVAPVAAVAAPPAKKPRVQYSAPAIAYKYKFAGPQAMPRNLIENTERQQPNQPTPTTTRAENETAYQNQAPVEYERWDARTLARTQQTYAENPYTGQYHPYSYGFYSQRQAAPGGHELSELDEQRNADALQMYYEGAYSSRDQEAREEAEAATSAEYANAGEYPQPSAAALPAPGPGNNQPLT